MYQIIYKIMKITKIVSSIAIFSTVMAGLTGCKKDNNTSDSNPTVVVTTPFNNTTSVERNIVVSAEFSGPMNSSTINVLSFVLMKDNTPIQGTVHYSDVTATFTPKVSLESNTKYTATISTDAKSTGGNSLAANKVWSFTTGSVSKISAVNLRTAGNFIILAKTAIANSSTSNVTGDVGLSPAATSYITGFPITNATGYATSPQINGLIYAADMAAPTPINMTTAINNMVTAYNDAAGRVSPDFTELATGNIGGATLTPGLYKWSSSVTMPSDVTISGGADDVWIFQVAGNLLMSSAVSINLIGGAQAKNVFWQVAGQVTIGSTAHCEGNILSMTGITFQTNASLKGRALAQTAVIMDSNVMVK
jgi:hypothetical protein